MLASIRAAKIRTSSQSQGLKMILPAYIFVSLLVFVSCDSHWSPVDPTNAKLVFYPKGSPSQSYAISEAASVLQHPNFVFTETHCYIHGYLENQGNESLHVIVDAYNRRQINLLTIDWALLVADDYFTAILNMMNLGPVLSRMFADLFNAGLPKDSFTLVGHSLGGQLAGLVGRKFIEQTDGQKLPAIWALDPAFPGFLPQDIAPFFKTIEKADGEFVAIMHTDIPNYGQAMPRGHVDFYPNGGLQGQPGCPSGIIIPFSPEDLCSHQRSWRFWAESVKYTNDPRFYAFPALNYIIFQQLGIGNLNNKAIVMGMECPRSARGTYFLKTNAQPRYAKGFEGY